MNSGQLSRSKAVYKIANAMPNVIANVPNLLAPACVDVGAHMIMLDVNAQSLADMKSLIDREGVTSFKLFMAYPGVLMVDDGALFKAMRMPYTEALLAAIPRVDSPPRGRPG